jgi:hypothetical protein
MAKRKIFLSYSRESRAKVGSLHERLSGAAFKPWMDLMNLQPGEEWEEATKKALQDSDFFLACLTKNSVYGEGFFKRELEWALEENGRKRGIYLIPVRLEACEVPDSLNKFQWVDLYKRGGWERLLKALHSKDVTPGMGLAAGLAAGVSGNLLADLVWQGRLGNQPAPSQLIVIILLTLAGLGASVWVARRPFSLPRFLKFWPGRRLFVNVLAFVLLAALVAAPLSAGLRLLMRNQDCSGVGVAALELELQDGRQKFFSREVILQPLDLYNRQNLAGRAVLSNLADREQCACEWWVKTNLLPRQQLSPPNEAKDCIFSIPFQDGVTEINLTLNVGRRADASGFEKVKYFRFKIRVQQ